MKILKSVISRSISATAIRNFSVSRKNTYQVSLIGAAGGVGQPLSMLLKINPLITILHLHDISADIKGVALDVSHIETPSCVKGFKGASSLCDALKGSNIVVIAVGVPIKPGMGREDLLKGDSLMVRNVMKSVAISAPKALIAIISNPINSVIPVACETLKQAGCLDPKRVFGVTTIDIVRANTFVAESQNVCTFDVKVPVIGGHSGNTIIPLLSRATPGACFSKEQVKEITARVQEAGTEILAAKGGSESATLCMAYAGARFTNALLRGLRGDPNVVECSYVMSDEAEVAYFSTPLVLGKSGIEQNLGIGQLSCYEENLLSKAIPELKQQIEAGNTFANKVCDDEKQRKKISKKKKSEMKQGTGKCKGKDNKGKEIPFKVGEKCDDKGKDGGKKCDEIKKKKEESAKGGEDKKCKDNKKKGDDKGKDGVKKCEEIKKKKEESAKGGEDKKCKDNKKKGDDKKQK